jgi:peptide/nickel transport system permease protein
VLALIVLGAIIAPIVPLPDAQQQSLLDRLQAPLSVGTSGVVHVLGTDQLGRDVLSRLLAGSRVSLGIAASVVVIAGASGSLIGMFAGYRGGWLDQAVMRLGDLQTAFPALLLAILLLYVAGASIANLILMLAFLSWVGFGRVARSQTLSLKQRVFVESAIAIGCTEWRVLVRHVLPHVLPALLALAVLDFAAMIVAEAGLSFLGLGVQPPNASWGLMLAQGQQFIAAGAWWLVVWPGLAMFVATLTANLASRALVGDLKRS